MARATTVLSPLAAAVLLLLLSCALLAEGAARTHSWSTGSAIDVITNCSVVIAGGSTSALAAAVASAREGVRTCLLEPTDWPGGQMTSAGDPSIDFDQGPAVNDSTGSVDIEWASHYPGNHAPDFFNLLRDASDNFTSTGRCSVSTNCFLPKSMLAMGINALLAQVSTHRAPHLL